MADPVRVAQITGYMNGGGVEFVVMNYYYNIDRERLQFDFVVCKGSTMVPRDETEALGGREPWMRTDIDPTALRILRKAHGKLARLALNISAPRLLSSRRTGRGNRQRCTRKSCLPDCRGLQGMLSVVLR